MSQPRLRLGALDRSHDPRFRLGRLPVAQCAAQGPANYHRRGDVGLAIFSILNKNLGQASHEAPASNVAVIAGYAATFLLAICGGFFSGGYVTMLTAAFVLLFGMTFLQAVAATAEDLMPPKLVFWFFAS